MTKLLAPSPPIRNPRLSDLEDVPGRGLSLLTKRLDGQEHLAPTALEHEHDPVCDTPGRDPHLVEVPSKVPRCRHTLTTDEGHRQADDPAIGHG